MIKSKKILALAAATTLTMGSMSSVMFAAQGETRLGAEACTTATTVEAYDIDYGTFLASEVQGSTHINDGTKTNSLTSAGTSRTPTGINGGTGALSADFYVFVDLECASQGFNEITVATTDMAEDGTLAVQPSAIPANAQRLKDATDGNVYLFNDSSDNPAMSSPVVADETTLDTATTVLDHTEVNNGIAGEYGALLSHEIVIPSNQVPATYVGTFEVTLVQ